MLFWFEYFRYFLSWQFDIAVCTMTRLRILFLIIFTKFRHCDLNYCFVSSIYFVNKDCSWSFSYLFYAYQVLCYMYFSSTLWACFYYYLCLMSFKQLLLFIVAHIYFYFLAVFQVFCWVYVYICNLALIWTRLVIIFLFSSSLWRLTN